MNITVFPKKLSGQVTVPPSKSVAHRMVIAAALSNGVSEITNLYPSVDILATMDCMRALGAKIDFDGDKAVIEGIKDIPESAVLDCCESGSTLRFLIPVACALGVDTQFTGRGRLPQRPITPYLEEFPNHGVSFEYNIELRGCDSAMTRQVIVTKALKGSGKENDPYREVTQYWSLTGKLLFELTDDDGQ